MLTTGLNIGLLLLAGKERTVHEVETHRHTGKEKLFGIQQ